ncbi:MAG: AbrB/MazE/SpoVT family DNA-binding domain-containing protein [Nanoarchaeota archaeon]
MVELRVRLGSKGQVVIPKILRETYGLYSRQEVIISEREEGVLIKNNHNKNPLEILDKISDEVAKKNKGKKITVHPHEIYEQYDKRAKRAGL